MKPSDFVHLHVHSDYSLLDGLAKVSALAERAAASGQTALALTDHGTVSGSIAFWKACKAAGVKPILGCEIYQSNGPMRERKKGYNHLTVLAKNDAGWRNLSRIASLANLEGFYYRPRVDFETLARHSEGLIVLSGCLKGPVPVKLQQDDYDGAKAMAGRYREVFGDDYYLEVQPNSLDNQKVVNEGCLKLTRDLGIPLAATCDLHYIEPGDAPAQEVRICIASGKTLSDQNRLKMKEDFFFRSTEQMAQAFDHVPEAILATREIAEKVGEYDLLPGNRNEYFLPAFHPPDGSDSEAYFDKTCEEGLKARYGATPGDVARERLEYEKGVIRQLGFTTYFLIVADFIQWARDNGCPVGPGRGSAAGSIVAYVLGITDVDPLRYDLLFERFLNPSRVSMPDIDVDFCEANRGKVIDYVRDKYGAETVCQIITFGTLKPKAVVKDVGRVLEIPFADVDRISKLIPEGPKLKSLDQAFQESPDLNALRAEPYYERLFDLALRLEGINRHAGKHAAGVVIADQDLLDRIPLTLVKGDKASQFTMTEVEEVGLLKMDFLGLRTLTLIEEAVRLIKNRGVDLDVEEAPLDDPEAFALLSRGETRGVFQLESSGFRKLLKAAKPDRFEDIIALIALYRPGPLGSGMDQTYIDRKHGREEITYLTDLLAPILGETYGCILYQEQVMRIANQVAGFSMADADNLRKAMGKKKVALMEKYKPAFVDGFVEKGVDRKVAEAVWDQIAFFASYGFNKCLAPDTVIVDAETGERTTVGELYEDLRPFRIHALGGDWRLRARRVLDVVPNGRKPVFELRTAQGKRIAATGNHPFRTLDGWTNLEDLQPGDRIAAPRTMPVATEARWPVHELVVLAGLLSEGNACHPSCLYFYGNDRELVDDFAAAATRFPKTVARVAERGDGRLEVCVSTGRRGHAPWNAGARGGTATARRTRRRSGCFRWAEGLGLLGRRAPERTIPQALFGLADSDVALFLGRLWAGDGFIANATNFTPYYATSSRRLAEDVQLLLLRLGIISGVHEKSFRYRAGSRAGFTVHLLGEGSVRTFVDRVLPHCVGRAAQAAQLRDRLDAVASGRSSLDTIPPEVRAWIDGERRAHGLTWRALEERSGVSTKELYGRPRPGKRGFRRGTIERLATFFGSARLGDLAASDVFWDRVVAIEPRGVEETFDLTVEGDHNFVADGVIVHNSHSAAYGIVTYRTAYLKAHYPVEFMAATLTSWLGDTDRLLEYKSECGRMEIEIVPPDVNVSDVDFDVRDEKIVYGLGAIKGIGEAVAEAVVETRKRVGRFRSIFHFCSEVDVKHLNKATLEALVRGGAFDSTGAHRRQMAEAAEHALQMGVQEQKDRLSQQVSLFGASEQAADMDEIESELLPNVPEWRDAELLALEKQALGFYLTQHPLDPHRETLERYATSRILDLVQVPEKGEVTVGGLVTGLRTILDKKGKTMAFVTLEDFSGACDCVVFGSVYGDVRQHLHEEAAIFVQGKVSKSREAPSILVDRVLALDDAAGKLSVSVSAELVVEETTPDMVRRLREVLLAHRGDDPLYYTFRRKSDDARTGSFRVGAAFRVKGSDALRDELMELLGPGTQIKMGARL